MGFEPNIEFGFCLSSISSVYSCEAIFLLYLICWAVFLNTATASKVGFLMIRALFSSLNSILEPGSILRAFLIALGITTWPFALTFLSSSFKISHPSYVLG